MATKTKKVRKASGTNRVRVQLKLMVIRKRGADESTGDVRRAVETRLASLLKKTQKAFNTLGGSAKVDLARVRVKRAA